MIELKVAKNHYKYLIAAFLILALAAIIKVTTSVVYAADKAGPVSERIVTIHDAGTEKGIATNASTLREVLKQADIRIDPKDMTEPGLDEPLVASSYEANIYRARPVAIKDGATTTRIITAYRTGKQIAKQANIELLDADKAELSPAKDIITDGAAEVLTIDRATRVTFVFYGKTLQTSTRATTVGGMLSEKDIKMADTDTIAPGLDVKISAGLAIQLWRNGKQVVTVDEDVAFKTRTVKDANRDASFKEVQTPGEAGRRTVTYEIEMKDGQEVGRKEISAIVTKEPVEQVELVGSKPAFMPYTGGGSKSEWLAASGIDSANWGYADWLVQKESGWNPNAINKSSGACGLAQALPCSKVPGNPLDPVDSLTWMNGYVMGRYGSWEAAIAHSKARGWY